MKLIALRVLLELRHLLFLLACRPHPTANTDHRQRQPPRHLLDRRLPGRRVGSFGVDQPDPRTADLGLRAWTSTARHARGDPRSSTLRQTPGPGGRDPAGAATHPERAVLATRLTVGRSTSSAGPARGRDRPWSPGRSPSAPRSRRAGSPSSQPAPRTHPSPARRPDGRRSRRGGRPHRRRRGRRPAPAARGSGSGRRRRPPRGRRGDGGALPSVVGGLTGVPLVAVPTSVGYGTSLGDRGAADHAELRARRHGRQHRQRLRRRRPRRPRGPPVGARQPERP